MFPEGRILEFMIVGALALMIIGPKDLPIMLRKLGQFVGRMRGMAAEFRASFDELARQSELDELRKEVEALRSAQPLQMAADAPGHAEVQQTFDDIHASLNAGGMQLNPAAAYQPLESLDALPADAPAMTPLPKAEAAPRPPARKPRAAKPKPVVDAPPPVPPKPPGRKTAARKPKAEAPS
jgi:sec-independent protein translocase protein TatB